MTLRIRHILNILLAVLFTWVWYNHAWVSEESEITLRQVGNFVNGYGMVWNLGERVQAFTHPLWFFALSFSHRLTGELYNATFAISAVFAFGTIPLLLFHYRTVAAVIVLFALLFSQAFIDFTSSGLENPLSYLLVAAVFVRYFSGKYDLWLFLLMALAFLTRMDHALLLLPAALMAWWRTRFSVRVLVPAVGLVAAWFAFATFYFGYPLPNTFIAKVAVDIPFSNMAERFWNYVRFSFDYDVFTLVIIGVGALLPLALRSRTWVISVSILLYLGYLVRIGGDWMGGRFFSVLVLLAVMAIAQVLEDGKLAGRWRWGLLLLIPPAMLGSLPILNGPDDRLPIQEEWAQFDKYGAVNIRLASFEFRSLSNYPQNWPVMQFSGQASEPYYVACGGAGWLGVTQNRSHIIDICGLGSAYTARLPNLEVGDWPTGHYFRRLPDNFVAWLEGRADVLESPKPWMADQSQLTTEPELTRLFEDVRLVISGPLFSAERLQAIWRMNFGTYEIKNPDAYTEGTSQVGSTGPIAYEILGALPHPQGQQAAVQFDNFPLVFGYRLQLCDSQEDCTIERITAANVCTAARCRANLTLPAESGNYTMQLDPLVLSSYTPYFGWQGRFVISPTYRLNHVDTRSIELEIVPANNATSYRVDVYAPDGSVDNRTLDAETFCTLDACILEINVDNTLGRYDVWSTALAADGSTVRGWEGVQVYALLGGTTLDLPTDQIPYTDELPVSFPPAAGASEYLIELYTPNGERESTLTVSADNVCSDNICSLNIPTTGFAGVYQVRLLPQHGDVIGLWTNGLINVAGNDTLTSPEDLALLDDENGFRVTFPPVPGAISYHLNVYANDILLDEQLAMSSAVCNAELCTINLPKPDPDNDSVVNVRVAAASGTVMTEWNTVQITIRR